MKQVIKAKLANIGKAVEASKVALEAVAQDLQERLDEMEDQDGSVAEELEEAVQTLEDCVGDLNDTKEALDLLIA